MKLFAWALLATSSAWSQTPSIDHIMARVAANQEKSVEARKQFVYRQDELVSMHESNGKLSCRQRREYTVTPTPSSIERKLVSAPGDSDHCVVNLSGSSGESLAVRTGSEGDSFTTSLGASPDGVPNVLFPLTAKAQRLYEFKLTGAEKYRGRQVYRVSFRPNHQKDANGTPGYSKGYALIDVEEYQPLQVVTDLSTGIPLAARILLGTSVHGLGFTVSYDRVADGVWFPAGFGGEFSVRALFFFKRAVAVNVTNRDFRRTDVTSQVTFEGK